MGNWLDWLTEGESEVWINQSFFVSPSCNSSKWKCGKSLNKRTFPLDEEWLEGYKNKHYGDSREITSEDPS